ncbi:MAG: hypothetical protein U0Q16_26260 [Bryobacteraceae bacterium]
MVDFWEIVGRVATDKPFRDAMYGNLATKTPLAGKHEFCCLFDDADYDAVRRLVVQQRRGPVSLMALGEWLYVAMLHPATRRVAEKVEILLRSQLDPVPSTQQFYQALGAALCDSEFRESMRTGGQTSAGFDFTPGEAAAFEKILNDPQNTFAVLGDEFHELSWSQACFAMAIQWTANRVAHPLTAPLSGLLRGRAKEAVS